MDRQKLRAKNCSYRDSNAPRERPTEYFMRKHKLLITADSYSDVELIMAIMEGAPKFWNSIIDTSTLFDVYALLEKIAYHEDALTHSPSQTNDNYNQLERRLRMLEQSKSRPRPFVRTNAAEARSARRTPAKPNRPRTNASTNLIGYSKDLPPPTYPRDDKTVSVGKTPEDRGVRPCRHCSSPKHWDNDCKYARKGARQARANFAAPSSDYLEAMAAYEEAYLGTSDDEPAGAEEYSDHSDAESRSEEEETSDEQPKN